MSGNLISCLKNFGRGKHRILGRSTIDSKVCDASIRSPRPLDTTDCFTSVDHYELKHHPIDNFTGPTYSAFAFRSKPPKQR